MRFAQRQFAEKAGSVFLFDITLSGDGCVFVDHSPSMWICPVYAKVGS